MNNNHLSQGGNGELDILRRELHTRRRLQSFINRRSFLQECIAEQVVPRSTPQQLRSEATPFTKSARMFLEECCREMKYKIEEIKSESRRVHIPNNMVEQLKNEDATQKTRLQHKLRTLCSTSTWRKVGRRDLINNMSRRILSDTETEALSLGLKFDTGIDYRSFTDYALKNYVWTEDDAEKGFKQGVAACSKALSVYQPRSLPRRYIQALEKLGKDGSIVITQADKGGGVVIMDKADYIHKMEQLLLDQDTYTRKFPGHADEEAKKFNAKVRKILGKSDRGKRMRYLLEEDPRPPSMRGLPKTHKPGVPMRPITSGIGSAPHRLAKVLAKPLSRALGSISGSHLRNSEDLLRRLRDCNMGYKKLASFDVKSLFTNVPVEGAMEAVRRVINSMNEEDIPAPRGDYLELVSMCMNFGPFTFEGEEYLQHSGLAMGSPLSAVAACLFMETQEKDHYETIIGRRTTWVRYVDDVLIITPNRTNLEDITRQLNEVNSRIQFTMEEEIEERLPFLDTVIIRTPGGPRFKVYRRPTNRDDFIHYPSAHSERTKTGVVVGFFLCAYRICSEEFLEEEINYILSTFTKLGYPRGLLVDLQKKAEKIISNANNNHNRSRDEEQRTRDDQGYMTLPNSDKVQNITKVLKSVNMKSAVTSGTKIADIVKSKKKRKIREDSIVYEIPCASCDKSYYGETKRGLNTRLSEHKADLRHHRVTNAMVGHVDEAGHLPQWNRASILHKDLQKRTRKAIEAAYIITRPNTNSKAGSFTWARTAADMVTRDWTNR